MHDRISLAGISQLPSVPQIAKVRCCWGWFTKQVFEEMFCAHRKSIIKT